MELHQEAIAKALHENRARAESLSEYASSYRVLSETLDYFEERYSARILVPICPRVFAEGKLVHTNEVCVSLGCDYFAECSSKDARRIAERRLRETDRLSAETDREREHLERQIEFEANRVIPECGREIVEEYDEERETKWKEEHRRRTRAHRERENRLLREANAEEIMDRLDFLLLREDEERALDDDPSESSPKIESPMSIFEEPEIENDDVPENERSRRSASGKTGCLTEEDVFARLEELEEEEYYEDMLERCSDGSPKGEFEDGEIAEETSSERNDGRRVSFAAESADEKLLIRFFHDPEPSPNVRTEPGTIRSPSDVYMFMTKYVKTKSIIKNCHRVKDEVHRDLTESSDDEVESSAMKENRSVYIADVREKRSDDVSIAKDVIVENSLSRPISKFKAARLADKYKK